MIGSLLAQSAFCSGDCVVAGAVVSRSSQRGPHVLLPLSKLLPIAKALGLTAVILRFEATASLAAPQSTTRR
jgi:hypothetical protein